MTDKKTILVVEDNPDNMQLVSWILEDEGYEVLAAETAEIGLALLEKEAVDLVLMDISLPGMDGKTATKKIRADQRFKGLPVLALTAHAVKGEQEPIWASGVDDLLTKPIDETLLAERLEHFLG